MNNRNYKKYGNKRVQVKVYLWPDVKSKLLKGKPRYISTSAYIARIVEDFLRKDGKK